MNFIKKYRSRSLWLAALLMIATIAGCDNKNSTSDAEAPIVVKTVPVAEATDVVLNTNVVVTFSEEMDDTSFTVDSFTVKGLNEDALIGTIVYDAASKSVSFDPDRNFTVSTVYTATVTTAVKSAAGISMEEDYSWSFTSGATLDIIPPTVVSTDPADAAIDVPLNRNVTATFSETLEPSSVNSTTFTLKKGSTLVPGAVSYDSKVTTFNPTNDLDASTVYTATLTTGIKDVAGNALATAKVWSFTTGADTAIAKGPDPVNLKTAGDFVILTEAGVTNVPTSAITGNIGASPITATSMNNVTCAEVTGFIYGVDETYTGSGDVSCFEGDAAAKTKVDTAVLDRLAAYNDAAGRATPDFTDLHAGILGGQTLVPGLYKWTTGVSIASTTNVILNGGSNDVWIFQIAGDVTQAGGTQVLLEGGALAKNVFWQVAGGTGVSVGTSAVFQGIVLSKTGAQINTSATVTGRLLVETAVTLDQNTVTQPAE